MRLVRRGCADVGFFAIFFRFTVTSYSKSIFRTLSVYCKITSEINNNNLLVFPYIDGIT